MNRIKYFWLGVLALIMLCLSILFIQTGRWIYGPDAYLIAIMGYFFGCSLNGLIESFMGLCDSKQRRREK